MDIRQTAYQSSVGRWNVAIVRCDGDPDLCERSRASDCSQPSLPGDWAQLPHFSRQPQVLFLSSPVGASASAEMSKPNQMRRLRFDFPCVTTEVAPLMSNSLHMTKHLGETALARHEAVRRDPNPKGSARARCNRAVKMPIQ